MGEVGRSTAVDKELGTGRGPIFKIKIIPETNNAIAKKKSFPKYYGQSPPKADLRTHAPCPGQRYTGL